ncbi:hypothetical protein L218DRAFT_967739 [Marasmius fiardii PR-910]|nr:hypothetical protein L218DRAFT_967739 [Marasmius fiardii PR-910]
MNFSKTGQSLSVSVLAVFPKFVYTPESYSHLLTIITCSPKLQFPHISGVGGMYRLADFRRHK